MSYAIIGFGAVGQALAGAFARKDIEVTVATTRPPTALVSSANAIGSTVIPRLLKDALAADTIILAVPFWAHREIAQALSSWHGKIVIDVTNAYGVALPDLDNLPSSKVIANALPGARLVKAFNHLPAAALAKDPALGDGRRVIFLSSDDEGATSTVADLVERLGYAPLNLGKLSEGGTLIQARGKSWAPLIFQDLYRQER
jgi:predicted dinucleotide-binding enzyme